MVVFLEKELKTEDERLKLTKEEFIKSYCKGCGILREQFDRVFKVMECDCTHPSCHGWKVMVIRSK